MSTSPLPEGQAPERPGEAINDGDGHSGNAYYRMRQLCDTGRDDVCQQGGAVLFSLR